MAKRNSRNNHLKRMQKYFAGNVRIWRWETDFDEQEEDDTSFVNLEIRKSPMLKKYVRQHPKMIAQMATYPQDWMLCCRALCKNDNAEWIETEMVSFRSMALTEFSSAYFDMRDKVLAAIQKRHIIDLGWIAHTQHPRLSLDSDWYMYDLGETTEQRQMAWNYSESLAKKRIIELKEAA